jgi:hypothetical protein
VAKHADTSALVRLSAALHEAWTCAHQANQPEIADDLRGMTTEVNASIHASQKVARTHTSIDLRSRATVADLSSSTAVLGLATTERKS